MGALGVSGSGKVEPGGRMHWKGGSLWAAADSEKKHSSLFRQEKLVEKNGSHKARSKDKRKKAMGLAKIRKRKGKERQ